MHINCLLINPVFLPSTLVFGGGFVLVWLFAECTGTCALWTDKMSESEVRERGSEGGTDRDEHGRSWLMHPPVLWAAQPRTLISRPNRMGRAYRSYTERGGGGRGGEGCGVGLEGRYGKRHRKKSPWSLTAAALFLRLCVAGESATLWSIGLVLDSWLGGVQVQTTILNVLVDLLSCLQECVFNVLTSVQRTNTFRVD